MELKNKLSEVSKEEPLSIFAEESEEEDDSLKQILTLFKDHKDPEQIARTLHEEGLYD